MLRACAALVLAMASADSAGNRRMRGQLRTSWATRASSIAAQARTERAESASAAGLEVDLALLAGRCVGQGRRTEKFREPARRDQPLTLIHIPRTGGTTIEECTLEEPVAEERWGYQHPSLKNEHVFFSQTVLVNGRTQRYQVGGCSKQHVPPSYLGMAPPYSSGETFCTVRNPYDRVLSQLGFVAGHNESFACSVADMNRYVIEEVSKLRWEPYAWDCHLLPQAAYVRGWDPQGLAVDRTVASCSHVLRFESLGRDFNALMAAKGYPYRLSEDASWRTRSPGHCRALSRAGFSARSRRIIEEVYKDDFELFGYERIG